MTSQQLAAAPTGSAAVTDDGHVFVWGRVPGFPSSADAAAAAAAAAADPASPSPSSSSPRDRDREKGQPPDAATPRDVTHLWRDAFSPSHATDAKEKNAPLAVATSSWTTLLLSRDGAVRAFTLDGRVAQWSGGPAGSVARRAIAVACGAVHAGLVDDSGAVWTWGSGRYGNLGHGDLADRDRPTQIDAAKLARVVHLAMGGKHSLACTETGECFSWGATENGRLGGRHDCTVPGRVASVRARSSFFVKVVAGEAHSGAITDEGKLLTWGAGGFGRLGHGNDSDLSVPSEVEELAALGEVVCASFGTFHSAAVLRDGRLYAWGSGAHDRLGLKGDTANHPYPTRVMYGDARFTQVACGPAHTLACTTTGAVVTWGLASSDGRLGRRALGGASAVASAFTSNGGAGGDAVVPPIAEVMGHLGGRVVGAGLPSLDASKAPKLVAAVAGAASATTAAATATPTPPPTDPGDDSTSQQQQTATTALPLRAPPNVNGRSVRLISVGCAHTVAVTHDNEVYTWGSNRFSQLGVETPASSAPTDASSLFSRTPRRVTVEGQALRAHHASAGWYHTLVATTRGECVAWGRGSENQLGTGISSTSTATPTVVTLLSFATGSELFKRSVGAARVVFVDAGETHSSAVISDGRLYVWGSGDSGKLGLGPDVTVATLPRLVPLDAKVASVSLGPDHTLAVTSVPRGKLYAWGAAWFGRLGHGSTLNEYTPKRVEALDAHVVVQASAGSFHSACVTEDGGVFVWGRGDARLGLGGDADRLTPVRLMPGAASVVAGDEHTLVLTRQGNVVAFGRNTSGKLGLDGVNVEADVSIPETIPSRVMALGEFPPPPDAPLQRDIRMVASRTSRCVALAQSGAVYTWGRLVELGDAATSGAGATTPATTTTTTSVGGIQPSPKVMETFPLVATGSASAANEVGGADGAAPSMAAAAAATTTTTTAANTAAGALHVPLAYTPENDAEVERRLAQALDANRVPSLRLVQALVKADAERTELREDALAAMLQKASDDEAENLRILRSALRVQREIANIDQTVELIVASTLRAAMASAPRGRSARERLAQAFAPAVGRDGVEGATEDDPAYAFDGAPASESDKAPLLPSARPTRARFWCGPSPFSAPTAASTRRLTSPPLSTPAGAPNSDTLPLHVVASIPAFEGIVSHLVVNPRYVLRMYRLWIEGKSLTPETRAAVPWTEPFARMVHDIYRLSDPHCERLFLRMLSCVASREAYSFAREGRPFDAFANRDKPPIFARLLEAYLGEVPVVEWVKVLLSDAVAKVSAQGSTPLQLGLDMDAIAAEMGVPPTSPEARNELDRRLTVVADVGVYLSRAVLKELSRAPMGIVRALATYHRDLQSEFRAGYSAFAKARAEARGVVGGADALPPSASGFGGKVAPPDASSVALFVARVMIKTLVVPVLTQPASFAFKAAMDCPAGTLSSLASVLDLVVAQPSTIPASDALAKKLAWTLAQQRDAAVREVQKLASVGVGAAPASALSAELLSDLALELVRAPHRKVVVYPTRRTLEFIRFTLHSDRTQVWTGGETDPLFQYVDGRGGVLGSLDARRRAERFAEAFRELDDARGVSLGLDLSFLAADVRGEVGVGVGVGAVGEAESLLTDAPSSGAFGVPPTGRSRIRDFCCVEVETETPVPVCLRPVDSTVVSSVDASVLSAPTNPRERELGDALAVLPDVDMEGLLDSVQGSAVGGEDAAAPAATTTTTTSDFGGASSLAAGSAASSSRAEFAEVVKSWAEELRKSGDADAFTRASSLEATLEHLKHASEFADLLQRVARRALDRRAALRQLLAEQASARDLRERLSRALGECLERKAAVARYFAILRDGPGEAHNQNRRQVYLIAERLGPSFRLTPLDFVSRLQVASSMDVAWAHAHVFDKVGVWSLWGGAGHTAAASASASASTSASASAFAASGGGARRRPRLGGSEKLGGGGAGKSRAGRGSAVSTTSANFGDDLHSFKRKLQSSGQAFVGGFARASLQSCEAHGLVVRLADPKWEPWRRMLSLAFVERSTGSYEVRCVLGDDTVVGSGACSVSELRSLRRRFVLDWSPASAFPFPVVFHVANLALFLEEVSVVALF